MCLRKHSKGTSIQTAYLRYSIKENNKLFFKNHLVKLTILQTNGKCNDKWPLTSAIWFRIKQIKKKNKFVQVNMEISMFYII